MSANSYKRVVSDDFMGGLTLTLSPEAGMMIGQVQDRKRYPRHENWQELSLQARNDYGLCVVVCIEPLLSTGHGARSLGLIKDERSMEFSRRE